MKTALVVTGTAFVAFVLGIAAGGSAKPVPTTTAVPTYTYSAPALAAEPAELPAGQFGAGTYVVGTDIQPGTYKTAGPLSGVIKSCYWERMKNLDGDMGSISANDNIQGPGVLTVKPGDKGLKLSGSCVWTKK